MSIQTAAVSAAKELPSIKQQSTCLLAFNSKTPVAVETRNCYLEISKKTDDYSSMRRANYADSFDTWLSIKANINIINLYLYVEINSFFGTEVPEWGREIRYEL